ncbi:hypothetical protein ACLOJK_021450 [Asimina triloba]
MQQFCVHHRSTTLGAPSSPSSSPSLTWVTNGKARPSIDRVTPALEHALTYLLGKVVLGSSRLHKIPSQVSSNLSSKMETVEAEDLRCEFRAPSWITFPRVVSSQRRKSLVSVTDVVARITDGRNAGGVSAGGDGLRCLEEEIGTASAQ